MSGDHCLVLTGTIGVGKTTLAEAVSVELHERGVRHGLLDLDWLGQVYPVPDGHDPYGYELALENLAAIWPNFSQAGARRAIIAGTVLEAKQRDRLVDAVGGIPATVVLLTASQDAIEERIRTRDTGTLQEDFLARTAEVARTIRSAGIHDLEIDTTDDPPAVLARDLLKQLG